MDGVRATHCVQAAFVDFIQDHNAVVWERRICQDLSEQTAVCHVLHHRVLPSQTVTGSTCGTLSNKFTRSEHQVFGGEWALDCLWPVMCSRQSALGSPPLSPESTASPGPPCRPQWWQPPCGAEWCRSCHLYKYLFQRRRLQMWILTSEFTPSGR